MKKALAVLSLLVLPAVVTAEELSQDRVDELKALLRTLQGVEQRGRQGTLSTEQAAADTKSVLDMASSVAGQKVNSRQELER